MGSEKKPEIVVDGRRYLRIPVKTHVLTERDDPVEIARKYALPPSQSGDVLFIAEPAKVQPARFAPPASGAPKPPNGKRVSLK